jgi:hypothetical protein
VEDVGEAELIPHLYRYRSIKQLLGEHNELEEQEIYFCPPEDLNDPVEGFKDLLWQGDGIIWRNLLKHYILCLLNVAPSCFGGAPDCGRGNLRHIVFSVPDGLPAAPIRDIYARVSGEFLRDPAVGTFVEAMAKRTWPVRRNELTHYFRVLQPFALQTIFKEFAEHGLMPMPAPQPPGFDPESLRANAIKMIESTSLLPTLEKFTDKAAEGFFAASESTCGQLDLISEYQIKDRAATRPMAFFSRYFPGAYVGALERLVHPDWYVACFSTNPVNPSMWGAYGDGHHGVCLKFRTTANGAGMPALSLNTVTGLGGTKEKMAYSRSSVPIVFHKIEYTPAYPPIDFFTSLGSVSRQNLNHFWYRGEHDDFSPCLTAAFTDEAARTEYWKAFESGCLFKTREWAHEDEYRLVLHSGFDLREKPMRTLQYAFQDLSGVIFGARTDLEDKLKIMRIIDQKCGRECRSDFQFFEVQYTPENAAFRLVPLSLLKIKYQD